MKISTVDAPESLTDILHAGLVPMLVSSPGVGKSTIIMELAKKNKLKVIDLRLSQCDPTDLNGFPSMNAARTRSGYVPMDTFPIEGDPIPEGYVGWLLLLDELNSASQAVQAAAYKIVLDRQVGQFNMHKRVAIVAAGNLATDKAIVNRMSTAMQSRMCHFELEVNHNHWLDWAHENGIDYRVTSYIGFKPNILHNFNPDHNDYTFPCPRTWEFVSKIIKDWKEIPLKKIPSIAAAIGEGAGREFFGYTQIFERLPTIQSIIANPAGIEVPNESSIQFAIAGLLTHNASKSNIQPLMTFINRLPIEFQVITIKGFLKRTRELLQTDPVKLWIKINSRELM